MTVAEVYTREKRFTDNIGMPVHKLVEWVVFGISVNENVTMSIAANHYLTTFILNKFMSIEAVADIMNTNEAKCKSDVGMAKYHISKNTTKHIEVFLIIASINHEREVLKLAA